MRADGVADAYRCRDGLRVRAGLPRHERSRAGRLEAHHARKLVDFSKLLVLLVSGPVGADVAGVADRDGVPVGRAAEGFAYFPRAAALSPEPVWVDGVYDCEAFALRSLTRHLKRAVEISANGDDLSAVHKSLRELAERDLPRRKQDEAGNLRRGGVSGGGGRGVAGRCADERLRAVFERLRYGHDHSPVLERTGGVAALELRPKLYLKHTADAVEMHERRRTFAERNARRLVGYRKKLRVPVDNSHKNSSIPTAFAYRYKKSRPCIVYRGGVESLPRFHSYSAVVSTALVRAVSGAPGRLIRASRERGFGASSEVVFKSGSTKAFQRFSPLSVKSPNFTIPVIAVRLSSSMSEFILLAIMIVKYQLIFDILSPF